MVRGGRLRPSRGLRRRRDGRGMGPSAPRARLPAPADGAIHGARRVRPGDRLSHAARDRRGLRPRPAARHRPPLDRGRRGIAARAARSVRGDPAPGGHHRRRGGRVPTAPDGRGGDGASGTAPPRPGRHIGGTPRCGAARVFDTLLDEQSILGLALGAGLSGLLPVAEIQYLAYLHNAEDQLRGEAATLQFFSQGAYRNPMVVRVAAYGYQKGFGGHFHNDHAVGVLRDIPGLVVASPARPDDAAAMLRTCVAAAKVDGSVCVFLEPIALYHTRDLHEEGDGGWLAPYPDRAAHVPLGSARTYGNGADLTLVTFGNGLYMSLRVARRLAAAGIGCRVLDLRWLAPLPVGDLLREARASGRVLAVDETRRSGGVAEGVLAALVDAGFEGPMARVASEDSFVPLGDAAKHVLLAEVTIEKAATELARRH